ncbi:hypothetical protein PSFL111601_28355 [Pseudomonas floridensis]
MVARRGRHHAASRFLGRQLRQLVIGAANLEGEHRLQVFALEQHLIAEPLGQLPRALQRSFDGDVVDAGGEDFACVVVEQVGLGMIHRVVSLHVVDVRRGAASEIDDAALDVATRAIERWIAIMSDS